MTACTRVAEADSESRPSRGARPRAAAPARPVSLREGRRAAGAQAADREVGEAGLETKPLADLAAHRVELLRAHRHDRTALLAVQVLPLAGADERVQAGTMAKVHVLDDAVRFQRLEVSIHRGDVDVRSVGDPLGGHRPVGGEELLEDEPPRRREAKPARPKRGHRLVKIAEGKPIDPWRSRHRDPSLRRPALLHAPALLDPAEAPHGQ